MQRIGVFFFKNKDWMSSSRSSMWGDEILEISYTFGAAGEGFTPRRLSSIRIDCEETFASSLSSTICFSVGEGMNSSW